MNLNLNVNEFFGDDHLPIYLHELAGTAKKIFPKEKILPDCNPGDPRIRAAGVGNVILSKKA
ncbi:MAG: hypothetical protein A2V67_04640 [Deltaproteobacteria bacterium RBG_13_61_14]|nr:MAG: hypothetical protein A2V67_04640 [Deltaproteobacteria bacterium RBG_13_61_14]